MPKDKSPEKSPDGNHDKLKHSLSNSFRNFFHLPLKDHKPSEDSKLTEDYKPPKTPPLTRSMNDIGNQPKSNFGNPNRRSLDDGYSVKGLNTSVDSLDSRHEEERSSSLVDINGNELNFNSNSSNWLGQIPTFSRSVDSAQKAGKIITDTKKPHSGTMSSTSRDGILKSSSVSFLEDNLSDPTFSNHVRKNSSTSNSYKKPSFEVIRTQPAQSKNNDDLSSPPTSPTYPRSSKSMGDVKNISPTQQPSLRKSSSDNNELINLPYNTGIKPKDELEAWENVIKLGDFVAMEILVKVEISTPDKPLKEGFAPLHLAITLGSPEKFDDPESYRQNAFSNRKFLKTFEDARLLLIDAMLSLGINVNINVLSKQNQTPLHLAVIKNYLKIAERLVSYYAKLNEPDNNFMPPIYYAIKNKSKPMIEMLIKKGAKLNYISKMGMTPLEYALFLENYEIAELLIKQGSELNFTNEARHNKTILHLSIQEKSIEKCKFVLFNGKAIIDQQDNNGDTALHIAVKEKFNDAIYELLMYGPNLNIKNNISDTALHLAIKNSCPLKIIKLFFKYKAPINAENIEKQTPLHLAAKNESAQNVELLLAHSVDMYLRDRNNNTPAEIIISKNNLKLIEIFSKYHFDFTTVKYQNGQLITANEEVLLKLISLGVPLKSFDIEDSLYNAFNSIDCLADGELPEINLDSLRGNERFNQIKDAMKDRLGILLKLEGAPDRCNNSIETFKESISNKYLKKSKECDPFVSEILTYLESIIEETEIRLKDLKYIITSQNKALANKSLEEIFTSKELLPAIKKDIWKKLENSQYSENVVLPHYLKTALKQHTDEIRSSQNASATKAEAQALSESISSSTGSISDDLNASAAAPMPLPFPPPSDSISTSTGSIDGSPGISPIGDSLDFVTST